MEVIKALLSKVRIPKEHEKVYKDCCLYSFDTPESETGLYVCLNTFLGFGIQYVEEYANKSGNRVFLHMKTIKTPIVSDGAEVPAQKVSRLAIGIEGGFQPDAGKNKFASEDINKVIVIPGFHEIILTDPETPLQLQLSVAAVLAANSAYVLDQQESATGTWDGEERKVSKHAYNLVQNDPCGKLIPPSGWKCEKCDLRNNLWLNLNDGTILCGRKFFDGSGGNNHAVEHYKESNYSCPLAVKLGTITSDGKGDVFSYDEDDMVEDPNLSQHLQHWGINIQNMNKTDKLMVELEIDANQRIGEWAILTESGSVLKPIHGPGFTGLENLGNSCYMNAVMQVLFTIPSYKKHFIDRANEIFNSVPYKDAPTNFNVQMAKLGLGLVSGRYSHKPKEDESDVESHGIRPYQFKYVVGKSHFEFTSKRQQDAQEFLLVLHQLIECNNRDNVGNPTKCFYFFVEDREECTTSGCVRYKTRREDYLPLSIPLEAAVNKEEVSQYQERKKEAEENKIPFTEEIVRPKISLNACLSKLLQDELVPDCYSSSIKGYTTLKRSMHLKTFPDFLIIQLKKFAIGTDWVPYKLDVEVDMPDHLDLSVLKAADEKPCGEKSFPEDDKTDANTLEVITIDDKFVTQLSEMGFSLEGCKKAVYNTKNTGIEAALNWVMEHMSDPDFNDPFHVPGMKAIIAPDEESVAMVVSMGFTADQAKAALKNTENNVERAIDWIFSHPNEINDLVKEETSTSRVAEVITEENVNDGPPIYKLKAFISHMGTSHLVGHYVCHINYDSQWVMFNDRKVMISENPPKGLGYLYIYERTS